VLIWSLPFHDNSFITHLATGRLILAGDFPREDVYSFSAVGEPWVVQSWLASVAYAGLERIAGSAGIHVLQVALCGVLSAIVWTLSRSAGTLIPRILASGLAGAVAVVFWSERPLMIGLVGMGLVLLALEDRLPPWVLVPVFWIWANAHGSYPLAIVLIVCVLAGRRLDREEVTLELRLLGFGVLGCLLAMIGPLGINVVTFPVEMLGRSEQLQQIVEWQSPDFGDSPSRLFLLQVVVAVIAITRRPSWRSTLPLVVFVAASLVAARNIAVASLILVPLTARGLAGLGSVRGDRRSPVIGAAAAVVGALAAVITVASVSGEGWSFELYPQRGLAWAAEQGISSPTRRILTQDYVGNFLEGVHGADAHVFVDDRYDMYPASVTDDYEAFQMLAPGWQDALDRNAFDAVVWSTDLPLAQALRESPGWRVIYQDGEWMIAERRAPLTD
jgi:hypothetical protein